jgi:hypothetical protein
MDVLEARDEVADLAGPERVDSGAITPVSSASDVTWVANILIVACDGSRPALTRTYVITPR